jgi:D-glycero-alpha-D-manno-heptose-7-phosphate kinase
MTFRSKAPLRISFAGGGTDVPPYPQERGGVVLSTTIDKYAYATLIPRQDTEISIQSLDYDIMAKYDLNEKLVYDGKLDLVKAVIRNMKMGNSQGVELFIHSDAPPGSGLGSSSTMVVALIGAFKHWLHRPMTDYEIAELAYHIEREHLGIKGGMQDQYAATFGGFNFIEFFGSKTVVNLLRIRPEILNELQYLLLLCYTGKTRLSAQILDTQINGYVQKREEVVRALDELKAITIAMKDVLLQGRLDSFGDLLHHAWENKKKLASQITNPHIDEMYEVARKHGALGGKILGAGGGGYLLLLCQFDKKHIIAEQLEKLGGQIVEFVFESQGLQTWEANQ